MGEDLVLFLDAEGHPEALADRCCHRTAKLSKGWCANGNIVCGYHGWTYDRDGKCARNPHYPEGSHDSGYIATQVYSCPSAFGTPWVAVPGKRADLIEDP